MCPTEWAYIHSHLSEKYNLQSALYGNLVKPLLSIFRKSRFSEKKEMELEFLHKYKKTHEEVSKSGPAVFRRVANTHGVSHFVHTKNENKSLLIIWTGGQRRPMMPLHTFLQAAWECDVDVVVLRAKPRHGYITGVVGLGDSLPKTVDALSEFVNKHGYSNIYVIGMSMGTPPALFSSAGLRAKNCLLAGPLDPRLGYNFEFSDFMDNSNTRGSFLRVTAVTGELATKDSEVADYLTGLLGSKKLVIPGAAHNPLWPIAEKGELANWLKQHLFVGVDKPIEY